MPFDMPKTGTWEQRGGWVVKRLAADLGLTLTQAAGLVGNLGYESRGFTALQEVVPLVRGSRGGYGWAQWTGPRRNSFEAWCNATGLMPSSDQANYEFLLLELRGAYSSTVVALKQMTTLAQAVFSVGQTYEHPAGTTPNNLPGNADRLVWARRALAGAQSEDISITPSIPPARDLQRALANLGLYLDEIDGIWGPKSSAALGKFYAG